MDAFRLQMVYELSVGALKLIVEKGSSIYDHNEKVKLPHAEHTICAKSRVHNTESLGSNIDTAEDKDGSYAEAENDTDCDSDTDGDLNAGVPQELLVPNFRKTLDIDNLLHGCLRKRYYLHLFTLDFKSGGINLVQHSNS
ncbi:hypothetical protein EMCRGX_G004775 [Ephydatia muelleri]